MAVFAISIYSGSFCSQHFHQNTKLGDLIVCVSHIPNANSRIKTYIDNGKTIEIKSTMYFYRHSKPKYFWCINEGNLLTRERKQVVDESLYSKLHALSV